MRAIAIIKSEHQNLGAVLYSLEHLLQEIEAGKQPDFGVFHGLLTYIDRFLDRYHHPKESRYLFPRLLARAPACAGLIHELEEQHRDGETLFIDMLKALSAYQFLGESELDHFRSTVLIYTDFERNHARLEEREVLPLAVDRLRAEDWIEINAAFVENEDPMFTRERDNEFTGLFSRLVNQLPAPLGLSEVWKQVADDPDRAGSD